jgi:hypothetical protein
MFAWLALSLPAFAQSPSPFTLRISEKEMELAHTDDMTWHKFNMWDIGAQRMFERNMPVFEVTNESDNPMTELHITIGDARFNFANDFMGAYAVVTQSTIDEAEAANRALVNITSSTLGNFGDELIIMFTEDGLKKEDGPLRFRIDLDVDPTYLADPHNFFEHPDYRTVLFDITGLDLYGPQGNEDPNDPTADNGEYWAVFDPETGDPISTLHKRFADAEVDEQFQDTLNEEIRPYGEMDPVGLFSFPGAQIPEPTSAVLAVGGLVCGLFATTRRRRRIRSSGASFRRDRL